MDDRPPPSAEPVRILRFADLVDSLNYISDGLSFRSRSEFPRGCHQQACIKYSHSSLRGPSLGLTELH